MRRKHYIIVMSLLLSAFIPLCISSLNPTPPRTPTIDRDRLHDAWLNCTHHCAHHSNSICSATWHLPKLTLTNPKSLWYASPHHESDTRNGQKSEEVLREQPYGTLLRTTITINSIDVNCLAFLRSIFITCIRTRYKKTLSKLVHATHQHDETCADDKYRYNYNLLRIGHYNFSDGEQWGHPNFSAQLKDRVGNHSVPVIPKLSSRQRTFVRNVRGMVTELITTTDAEFYGNHLCDENKLEPQGKEKEKYRDILSEAGNVVSQLNICIDIKYQLYIVRRLHNTPHAAEDNCERERCCRILKEHGCKINTRRSSKLYKQKCHFTRASEYSILTSMHGKSS